MPMGPAIPSPVTGHALASRPAARPRLPPPPPRHRYFDGVQGELAQLKLAASARDTMWAMSMVGLSVGVWGRGGHFEPN